MSKQEYKTTPGKPEKCPAPESFCRKCRGKEKSQKAAQKTAQPQRDHRQIVEQIVQTNEAFRASECAIHGDNQEDN